MSFLSYILGANTDNPYAEMKGMANQFGYRANQMWDPNSQFYTGRMREISKVGNNMAMTQANNNRASLARQGINSFAMNKQFNDEAYGSAADKAYSAGVDLYNQGAGMAVNLMGQQAGALSQYGQGKQWAGEQENGILNQMLGIGGSLLMPGGMGFLSGIMPGAGNGRSNTGSGPKPYQGMGNSSMLNYAMNNRWGNVNAPQSPELNQSWRYW